MTNTRVFTPQTTTPEPAEQVRLPIGENTIKYDKGRKVIQVSLLGRGRHNVRLRRREIDKMEKGLRAQHRGQPTQYGVDYANHTIQFYPAAVNEFVAVIEYGEKGDTVEATEEITG